MTMTHHITHEALMHGVDWTGQDVTGWTAQEKLRGCRALWTGRRLLTRQGHEIAAPAFLTDGLPDAPLDCELYAGPHGESIVAGCILSRSAEYPRWAGVTLNAFDAPLARGNFSERRHWIFCNVPWEQQHSGNVFRVANVKSLMMQLRDVLKREGEGLMLRHPVKGYIAGRHNSLLKVKAGSVEYALAEAINAELGAAV